MATSPFFDRILETSTTTGTGTITVAGAVNGYRTFGSKIATNDTTPLAIWEVDVNGNPSGAWEVAADCVYASSTLTRGTFKASSTDSAINFGAGTKHVSQVLPAFLLNQTALRVVTGTDADTTMEVNTCIELTMGTWGTADRTYTLPATAAVGDRVRICLTAGSVAFALIITAASGDTLNGVAGGTAWSKLFISYETVTMRCIVANATWIVEHDGRIAQKGLMRLSTSASAETAATFTAPTAKSGAWTADSDIGGICSTGNDRIIVRRVGYYNLVGGAVSTSSMADGKYFGVALTKNDTTTYQFVVTSVNGAAGNGNAYGSTEAILLAAGDYILYQWRSEEGSKGLLSSAAGIYRSYFSVEEVLP